jgi:hypothetical protein
MKQIFTITLLLLSLSSFSQTIHKTIEAIRTSVSPKIDGVLEPDFWANTPIANNFTQMEPRNGEPERENQKSEIKFKFNDRALFIGAQFYDSAPDSILTEFSMRDEWNKNYDWFGVWINTYNDSQNDFMFALTAAGVQLDSRSSLGEPDMTWDAVWKSAIKINSLGWTAEIEIPYSALRIPNTNIQEWGINIGREIRRTRESYAWNPIDISNSYRIQAGVLKGMSDIKPPLRLSLMPYISSYVDFYDSNKASNLNGGLDLKYGLNESFTLDMTLVPDFGQTVFDDQILNVSPFEVQFNENRSFFTEGTELFNKSQLFYSRRIGDSPSLNPTLKENEITLELPVSVQLLNASKISGRTTKGLGIGFFNAITEPTYATIEDTLENTSKSQLVEPLTNYSVLVFDQVLKNNSFITFTNTNVSREGKTADANVEKLQVQLGTKDNSYTFYGDLSYSHIFENSDNETGFSSFLLFEKSSGNFRFNISQSIESDKYDINDLGYLANNNEFNHTGGLSYNIFTPIGKLRKADFELSLNREMLYKPQLYNATILEGNVSLHFTNFFSTGISIDQSIGNTNDYYEARTEDLENVFTSGPSTKLFWWNSTDYRNRFAGDLGFGFNSIPEFGSKSYHIRWSPRFRVNDHIFMTYVLSHKTEVNNVGRAFDSNYTNLYDENERILFSKRDRKTITNVFKASFVVDTKLSFNFKLRHYWSTLQHKEFYKLSDGKLDKSNFTFSDCSDKPLYDINYNSWNIDINCLWRFAPGSELNLQWKNALYSLHNNAKLDAIQNINRLFEESQGNSLSLKLIYYLDYQYIKKFLI